MEGTIEVDLALVDGGQGDLDDLVGVLRYEGEAEGDLDGLVGEGETVIRAGESG